MSMNSGSEHTRNVRNYYDSFDPAAAAPSRLTFYSELFKRFPDLKAPDSVSKLSFGCQNPVETLLEELKSMKLDVNAPVKILDAGGGGGLDAFLLRQLLPNATIVNADISQKLLISGAETFRVFPGTAVNKTGGVNFICADAASLPIKWGVKFDFIISNALLNLIEDKERVLNDFSALLSESGALILCDVAFAGGNKPGPAFALGKTIADGTYFAPTVECEDDYPEKIFKYFKFSRIAERREMKPDMAGLKGVAFAIFCLAVRKNIPCEKETIPCRCGGQATIEIIQNVDVSEAPSYLKMIREGSLNSAVCPKCHNRFSDLVPFYFRWEKKAFEAHVFPAVLADKEDDIRMSLCGMGKLPGGDAGGDKAKLIFGFEKFRASVRSIAG